MTKEQIRAAIDVTIAVAQMIREAGQVPSGHLYASLMGHMDIEGYMALIGTLKDAGVIEEKNHMLIWKGPAK